MRKIFLFVFLCLLISTSIVLAGGDEWILSHEDKIGSYYVEKKSVTLTFHPEHMTVDFWFKTEPTIAGVEDFAKKSGNENWMYNVSYIVAHITVNLNEATYSKDSIIIYDKNNSVLVKKHDTDAEWIKYNPQSTIYHVTNTAMKIHLDKRKKANDNP